ncbi:MAG: cysteine desulfurase family protein [Deferribacterota bacterium]|nr:cysteine desulfurase family protein [Deferribacterota bacterium]
MIYFDNSATTPVDSRVYNAMKPYFTDKFANPSSIHLLGREVNEDLAIARENISKLINALPEEVIFTGSGTESDNLALKGIAFALKNKGNHIITSSIEHKAVSETMKWLETAGFTVTYLPVDKKGTVDLSSLEKSINDNTILISIMLANNEIGTIEPMKDVVNIAKPKNIIVHTDAVQAIGKMKIDVNELGVDLLTFSGHKIYAPKGIGALYIENSLKDKIVPLIHGGGQEYSIRSGTENVPYIIGLAEACDIINKELDNEVKHTKAIRDKFEELLLKEIPDIYINGDVSNRVCNISNISFKYIEGEALMAYTPEICCSTGSACSSEEGPSHVLKAIGINPIDIHGTIRFSFGRFNRLEEVPRAVSLLKDSVAKLRKLSPLYNKNK